jgi:hypothetical protein
LDLDCELLEHHLPHGPTNDGASCAAGMKRTQERRP